MSVVWRHEVVEKITASLVGRANYNIPEWDVDLTKAQRNHIIKWVVTEIFDELQRIDGKDGK